ncbi:MAG: hypothetical protein H6820_11005 [Phycisphaerales bacterium]|nr:hypothetical protein [Phycisphaerales bacterium]
MIRPRAILLSATLIALLQPNRAPAQWPFETQTNNCNGILPVSQFDGVADRAIRRTDSGADSALQLGQHRAAELIGIRAGNWSPLNPTINRFVGCWNPSGHFLRLELAFDGLMNPPGRVGLSTPDYAPFEFGPHPVSGFVELDVDDNVDSGGDINNPENMYPGNIARFGGLPTNPELIDRIATLGVDNTGFLSPAPHVERSGEDFHIALFGDLIDETIEIAGDGDGIFESGEIWIIRGKLLHRAHGYAIFSAANGNGDYEPVVDLEFRHNANADVTVVSLVYPINNVGAAAMTGEIVQAFDNSSANQNSILEGLIDLSASVHSISPPLHNHPAFPLIQPWETQNPNASMDVSQWRITCHVGMSYPAQDLFGAFIAWTDAYPNAASGDFDGDGIVTTQDLGAFDAFISQHDGQFPIDADNAINGRVTLPDFGANFSLFDINYDGKVDDRDRTTVPLGGDINGDQHVDLADAADFVAALLDPAFPFAACEATPPFGACCIDAAFGPDLCFDGDPSDCQSQGGIFQGPGTTCAMDGCVFPVGACCVIGFGPSTTSCFEATLTECVQVGGTYYGLNTTCNDPIVTCESNFNEGACCLNSFEVRCIVMTSAECQGAGGAFQGVGTLCSDPQIACSNQATLSPCCLPQTGCVMLNPVTCVNQGGLPALGASACTEVTCPSPGATGACCMQSAGAVGCQELTASACFQFGGTYLGDGLSCTNTQCGSSPVRACCSPSGQCQTLPLFDCLLSGGAPQPGGIDCANADCFNVAQSVGACCVEIPALGAPHCIEMSDSDCALQGGDFAGIGSNCQSPAIACQGGSGPITTLPSTFVDVLLGRNNDADAVNAADVDRNSIVDGRDIQPYVNLLLGNGAFATGACCVSGFGAQSVCFIASNQDCDIAGGSFHGIGAPCTNSCDSMESITMACCLPNGCVDLTPMDCAASGGISDPDTLRCNQRRTRNRLQRCDVNADGRIDSGDIQAFVSRLLEN